MVKKKANKKELLARLTVYGLDGKESGNVQLDKDLFDGTINKTLIYEANKMYEANLRKGNASTKTRSEVSGGGAKPWRQKGTGRARVGSSRNPLWTHGGVAFGPKKRDYSYSMPKKSMRKALLSALNSRLLEDMIKPVVKIDIKEGKTKEFKKILDKLKISGKSLIVVEKNDEKVKRSSRNIKNITLKEANKVNTRDILLNTNIVIEKEALETLTARLKR